VFDRIIGGNVYEVPVNMIIPCFKAFMASECARDKIFFVIYKRIKKNLNEFSLDELCDLAMIFTSLSDGQADY
jgi:hypothetical protein